MFLHGDVPPPLLLEVQQRYRGRTRLACPITQAAMPIPPHAPDTARSELSTQRHETGYYTGGTIELVHVLRDHVRALERRRIWHTAPPSDTAILRKSDCQRPVHPNFANGTDFGQSGRPLQVRPPDAKSAPDVLPPTAKGTVHSNETTVRVRMAKFHRTVFCLDHNGLAFYN